MTLDAFRAVHVALDLANDYVPDVRLSANDYDGRVLVVTVTDGGAAVTGTGYVGKALFNVDPRDPDSSGGYFSLAQVAGAPTLTLSAPVPQGALTAETMPMCVTVTDPGGDVIASRNFVAHVERAMLNGDAPEAQDALDEFYAAVEALGGLTIPIPVVKGGTGATTAAGAPWLPKTGGTMTGTAIMENVDIDIDSNDITSGTAPSQNASGKGVIFRDSTNATMGIVRPISYSNGNECIFIDSRRTVSGSTAKNDLEIGVRSNGNPYVAVSDAGAWRSALNVVAASGGTYTGVVTMSANDIDLKASNYTVGTTPTSNTNSNSRLVMRDSAGTASAVIGARYITDGRAGLDIYATRNVNGLKYNNIDLYIDDSGNSSVVLGAPAAWRSAIGIGAYGSYTLLSSSVDLTTTAQTIAHSNFSGVNCSASGGGIKVAEAGTYEVWGQLYFYQGFTDQDIIHCMLYKDANLLFDGTTRTNGVSYQTITAGPIIVDLAANNVVYLKAYNQTAARGSVGSRSGHGIYVRRIA